MMKYVRKRFGGDISRCYANHVGGLPGSIHTISK